MSAAAAYEPRDHHTHISFRCPVCDRKQKAYAYCEKPDGRPNSFGDWHCSRASCGGKGSLLKPSASVSYPSKAFLSARQAKRKKAEKRKNKLKPGLGKLSKNALRYLQKRLLHLPLDHLLSSQLVGDPFKTLDQSAKNRGRRGYELFLPLRGIVEGQVTTGQCRFTGSQKSLGKRPKILSLKGSYPDGGAVFGHFEEALKASKKSNGVLIVAEGATDFLTLRALGFDNCVGVPGAAQAVNVARRLVETAWQGRLILSLDGDDAGQKSVERVLKIFVGQAQIQVFNARPPKDADINDIFLRDGELGIARLIQSAMQAEPCLYQEPKVVSQRPRRLSWEARSRARELYEKHLENTALRGIGRSGVCGLHILERWRVLLNLAGDLEEHRKSKQAAVCDSRACLVCRMQRWQVAEEHIRESWPESLALITIELEDATPGGAAKARQRLTSRSSKVRKSHGGGFMSFIDQCQGRVSVLIDPSFKELIERFERFYEVRRVSLAEAIKVAVKPAFIGLAARVSELLEDAEAMSTIEQDPWCTSRARAWSKSGQPGRLSLRTETDLEKAHKAELKEEAEAREGLDPAPVQSFDLFVYGTAYEQDIVAITLHPLSSENRLALAAGRAMELLPGQRGNLLDEIATFERSDPELALFLKEFYERRAGRPWRCRGEVVPPTFKVDIGPGHYERESARREPFYRMAKVLSTGARFVDGCVGGDTGEHTGD